MYDKERTLEERLIDAGFWSKEDGAFSGDDNALGIVLAFSSYHHSPTEHEARLTWEVISKR